MLERPLSEVHGYTVILRSLDHSSMVHETIAALRLQSIPPHEIIIVDSGSGAQERVVLESLADRFIDVSFRPFNYSFSINVGAFNCHTSHILIISSHVLLSEITAIEKLLQRLEKNSDLCGAYIAPASRTTTRKESPAWEESIIDASSFTGRNGLSNACSLLRRDDIRRHPFTEAVWAAEDQAWSAVELASGRKILRVVSRDMHYRNPRFNEKKRRNEQLAIANYVNTQEKSWLRIVSLLLKCLRQLLRGQGRHARKTALLAKGLFFLRLGKKPENSRYF